MKTKRIEKIEKYIKDNQTVSIEELTEKFDVSINTIRRDINILEKKNSIKKVYGGVTFLGKQQAIDFEERNIENFDKKKYIGKLASEFIEQDDIVYIDTGTTTIHLLENLDLNLTFTIITNSLDVINKASQFKNATIFLIGEKYSPRTRSFTGIKNSNIIQKCNIKKAFMSATGLNLKNGLTNAELDENIIKQTIIDRSETKFALTDSSKIGKSTLLTYANLKDIDYIITDKQLDNEISDYCLTHEIEIVTQNK
ncbi:DeoR/GlpR family DNA-binding transcription regulator [Mammaliicoccus sciuri]|uniref:DeoR/GlpR family DNA-binding transcription regulator n=1 Tax=Mammaliicoccus sciuri TaxID=1296 RepID=UPI001FB390D1|nr:DeoR/GlpR family DNA-binding transcription regulator [Mammaliicoccus sciuri]MCJ0925880.1 DeoR/GlpR family DNA-binding transcription regulator [Mammaliicoccus sciuri]MCJ1760481.1 DeoR/GlpR family DNA-binding transcription regulator [Mammaliicoccus sciuri]